MTTEKCKMILLHCAGDNAEIILDSEVISYVAPSLTYSGRTKIRLNLSGEVPYLNVRETPKEIAHLADWQIHANISGGCLTS